MVAGEPYTLCLFDTSSFKGVDQLRPSSYQDTDVFLVVFSIVNPASFENIKDKVISTFFLYFHRDGNKKCKSHNNYVLLIFSN